MDIDASVKCSCKWVKCKRHGKCGECIEHHKNHNKYPLPFCQRNPDDKKVKRERVRVRERGGKKG